MYIFCNNYSEKLSEFHIHDDLYINPFHSEYARGRSLPFHSGYACRRSQRTWWLHLVFIETVCTRSNFYRFPHNAKGLHFRLAPFVFV